MDERGLLERYGAWIASGFGGFALLGAAVFAARWAVREGLLGGHPEVGLAVGLVVGCTGMLTAELFWSRGARALAAGLAGSGLGIVYFALYGAHSWYDLLGVGFTSIALLMATAAGSLQAVRRDSELMAALGFVGGMATPLLLGSYPGPYFTYLAAINAALALASLWRGWRVLPWFGVGSTLLLGISWMLSPGMGQVDLLALVSVALLGVGYAALSAHPRIEPIVGLPWLIGAGVGLVASIPFTGMGGVITGVAVPLIALSLILPLLRLGAARHTGDPRFAMLATIYALGCISIVGLAARFVIGGSGGEGTALALIMLPTVSARLASLSDGDSLSPALTWIASLAGAALIALFGEVSHGWLIALAVASTGRLVGQSRGSREHAALSAFALAASAVCLVTSPQPLASLLSGFAIFSIAVLPSVFSPPRSALGYLPALISPVMLAPMMLSWRTLTGDDWLGVIPLVLACVTLFALLCVRAGLWRGEEVLRPTALAIWLALTVTLATVALPMQLHAQWLTIGLAAEGAALLVVSSRSRSSFLSVFALVLLAAVTVRLALNPAVLDYHLVKRPHAASWVWYGYGLPALAITYAAQVAWVPAPLSLVSVRRALEIAAIAVGFCGLNLLVSHGFAGGDSLALLDTGDAARAARTIGWSLYGVFLLALGGRRLRPWPRASAGLVLLALAALKLALWDLWLLDMLPSALALAAVALCAFVAAFLLGRAASRSSRPLAVEQP